MKSYTVRGNVIAYGPWDYSIDYDNLQSAANAVISLSLSDAHVQMIDNSTGEVVLEIKSEIGSIAYREAIKSIC